MRNLRLDLCYDGTRYRGWQRLGDSDSTIQGKLEQALSRILGEPIEVSGSGRTDAGVHARVYVANFRTESTIPAERLPYALNTHLPCDIVVTKAFEVHDRFNAIGSCVR